MSSFHLHSTPMRPPPLLSPSFQRLRLISSKLCQHRSQLCIRHSSYHIFCRIIQTNVCFVFFSSLSENSEDHQQEQMEVEVKHVKKGQSCNMLFIQPLGFLLPIIRVMLLLLVVILILQLPQIIIISQTNVGNLYCFSALSIGNWPW